MEAVAKDPAGDDVAEQQLDEAERSIFQIAEGRMRSGFVPLGHIAGTARLNERWHIGLELDGTAAPQGRAFDFSGIDTTLPTRTFEVHLDIEVGGRAVELIEVGPAHTRGDTLVYVPDARTVYTGDILFIGGTPIVWAGPLSNWVSACDLMLGMDVETVVPGHGPVRADVAWGGNWFLLVSDHGLPVEPAALEPAREHVAVHLIVFDEEDLHGLPVGETPRGRLARNGPEFNDPELYKHSMQEPSGRHGGPTIVARLNKPYS